MSLAAAVTDEVRRRMSDRHLSARALARATGVPASSLHRALNGERPLSLDELAAVAAVFELTPEHLLRVARTRPPSDG